MLIDRDEMAARDFLAQGVAGKAAREAARWELADRMTGRTFAQIEALTQRVGASRSELKRLAWMGRRFTNPAVRQLPHVTYSHYRVAAAVRDDAAREGLIRRASRERWTVAELQQRVRPYLDLNDRRRNRARRSGAA